MPVEAAPPPAGREPVPPRPAAGGAFSHRRYRFTTGLRPPEVAHIRSDQGQILLSYRSFASVVGVVAALVAGIVVVVGLAAVIFLISEGWPIRAGGALALTLAFSFIIALLVPRTDVTLYDENHPALTISQRSAFPSSSWVVSTPNGVALGELRQPMLARAGRNRWIVTQEGRLVGEAAEESFGRALARKLLGKFNRRFETNVQIHHGGLDVARIIRRPDGDGRVDELELTNDALDRRILVALATLILGREP